MKPKLQHVRIDDVKVGKRHRKDLGDLSALMQSMMMEQIQPIRLDPDLNLICGLRRLEAARRLGWETIEARVGDVSAPVLLERDENEQRKAFTVEERTEIGKEVEAYYREQAKMNQNAGRPKAKKISSGKLPELITPPETLEISKKHETDEKSVDPVEVKEKAAEHAGMSRHTYEKVTEVVDAAKENPAFRPIVDEMNETENVSAAHRKLKEAKAAKQPEPEAEIPRDKNGDPWPSIALPGLKANEALDAFRRRMLDAIGAMEELARTQMGRHMDCLGVVSTLTTIKKMCLASAMAYVCPYCDGNGVCDGAKCKPCKSDGWVNTQTYRSSPKYYKEHGHS